MKKVISQLIVLVFLFAAMWFGLSKIDYVRIFRLNNLSKKMEKKIGSAIFEVVKSGNTVIETDELDEIYSKIKKRLCVSTTLTEGEINIYLVADDKINAYALPGNNIIVNTGLIRKSDSISEVCGVIAHEIGHLELNHVMKRVAGEVGISVLTSMVTNGNSEVATRIAQHLSTTAFERNQEREADAFAVNCLHAAQISPEGFANFMVKMARRENELPEELEWISTHPDSKERAANIRSAEMKLLSIQTIPILNDEEWEYLKHCINDIP